MTKINYNEYLEKIIKNNLENNMVPKLLLHSCCAPCSSSVLTRLAPYFNITIFYYNPNITDKNEYLKRKNEEINFIMQLNNDNNFIKNSHIDFLDADYDSKIFFDCIKGLEKEKEGGKRCYECFKLRLLETAKKAKEFNFDYFGTTLTVSPYKNSQIINEIGKLLQQEYGVQFLFSDFKKQDGYKKSIELSKQYNLYRQDYCGCVFSLKERLENLSTIKNNIK